jgi:hypothetical protein
MPKKIRPERRRCIVRAIMCLADELPTIKTKIFTGWLSQFGT